MEYSNGFVCLLGIGTVFVGLISIIILCKIIGWCCQRGVKQSNADAPAAVSAPAAPITAEIPNRRETVAAIAAAIAEETGSDISAIRILSIERL